jgi:hypothetical protein
VIRFADGKPSFRGWFWSFRPICWQGWLATLLMLVVFMGLAPLALSSQPLLSYVFTAMIFVLFLAYLYLVYRKLEGEF